jgi:hypothetical protein
MNLYHYDLFYEDLILIDMPVLPLKNLSWRAGGYAGARQTELMLDAGRDIIDRTDRLAPIAMIGPGKLIIFITGYL